MANSLSRSPQLDMDKCLENSGGNRFNLVLIATIRARELGRQHRNSGDTTHLNGPVKALFDIQEGKVGPEYLKRVR